MDLDCIHISAHVFLYHWFYLMVYLIGERFKFYKSHKFADTFTCMTYSYAYLYTNNINIIYVYYLSSILLQLFYHKSVFNSTYNILALYVITFGNNHPDKQLSFNIIYCIELADVFVYYAYLIEYVRYYKTYYNNAFMVICIVITIALSIFLKIATLVMVIPTNTYEGTVCIVLALAANIYCVKMQLTNLNILVHNLVENVVAE